jgi:hypothetical protein
LWISDLQVERQTFLQDNAATVTRPQSQIEFIRNVRCEASICRQRSQSLGAHVITAACCAAGGQLFKKITTARCAADGSYSRRNRGPCFCQTPMQLSSQSGLTITDNLYPAENHLFTK